MFSVPEIQHAIHSDREPHCPGPIASAFYFTHLRILVVVENTNIVLIKMFSWCFF